MYRTQPQTTDLARLNRALEIVAMHCEDNDAYLPIFARLEDEIEALTRLADPVSRARQKLKGLKATAA